MSQPTQSQPWDGHGRMSSAAMVCAFLINGMVGWPIAMMLLISLIIESNLASAMTSAILFITGLATMGAVSHRERRRNVVILRWMSVGLNAVLFAMAIMLWTDALEVHIGPGMLLAGIAIINMSCVYLIRLEYPAPHCPACGFDLSYLRQAGCPECGWRRGASTPSPDT